MFDGPPFDDPGATTAQRTKTFPPTPCPPGLTNRRSLSDKRGGEPQAATRRNPRAFARSGQNGFALCIRWRAPIPLCETCAPWLSRLCRCCQLRCGERRAEVASLVFRHCVTRYAQCLVRGLRGYRAMLISQWRAARKPQTPATLEPKQPTLGDVLRATELHHRAVPHGGEPPLPPLYAALPRGHCARAPGPVSPTDANRDDWPRIGREGHSAHMRTHLSTHYAKVLRGATHGSSPQLCRCTLKLPRERAPRWAGRGPKAKTGAARQTPRSVVIRLPGTERDGRGARCPHRQ